MRTLSKHLSDAIMVLVAFLFPRSLLGVTIDHIAKGARKDHEDEDQEDERLHNDILCCCTPDTRFTQKTNMPFLVRSSSSRWREIEGTQARERTRPFQKSRPYDGQM